MLKNLWNRFTSVNSYSIWHKWNQHQLNTPRIFPYLQSGVRNTFMCLISLVFSVYSTDATALVHVFPLFLLCNFSLNTCICKKQPKNCFKTEKDTTACFCGLSIPWVPMAAWMANVRLACYKPEQQQKKEGEINRIPSYHGALSPGAALPVAHPSFLPKTEHQAKSILTSTVYFHLVTTSISFLVISSHTVVCPRWQEKNHSTSEVVCCSAGSSKKWQMG